VWINKLFKDKGNGAKARLRIKTVQVQLPDAWSGWDSSGADAAQWWRLRVGTEATATYYAQAADNSPSFRQLRVTLDLPLLMQARSLPAAETMLPELLAGLSYAQLILSAQLFSNIGFTPPHHNMLTLLELRDPSNLWIIESEILAPGILL